MAGLLAGVDLGGTSIKTVLADESGRVLAREMIPTESHQGPDAVLVRIADLIKRLRSNIHDRVGMFPTDAVQVVRSQLGDSAGLIGAIALAQTLVS